MEIGMNMNELINQKLAWLNYANEQRIAQIISTVCYVLGTSVENKFGVKCKKYEDNNNIEYIAFWNVYGFNTFAGYCNFKLFVGAKVNNTYVCRLSYINNKPDFPINVANAKFYDVESSDYIFVPGKWLDRLNENYEIALRNIKTQDSEEEKRISKLATQMLIDPKVEV